jgi:hypothetical protein
MVDHGVKVLASLACCLLGVVTARRMRTLAKGRAPPSFLS